MTTEKDKSNKDTKRTEPFIDYENKLVSEYYISGCPSCGSKTPKHTSKCKIHLTERLRCSWCGKDNTDYMKTRIEMKDTGKEYCFHSMHTGGHDGEVKKTCLDKFREWEMSHYAKK